MLNNPEKSHDFCCVECVMIHFQFDEKISVCQQKALCWSFLLQLFYRVCHYFYLCSFPEVPKHIGG